MVCKWLCCILGAGTVISYAQSDVIRTGSVMVKGFATIDNVALINVEGTGAHLNVSQCTSLPLEQRWQRVLLSSWVMCSCTTALHSIGPVICSTRVHFLGVMLSCGDGSNIAAQPPVYGDITGPYLGHGRQTCAPVSLSLPIG